MSDIPHIPRPFREHLDPAQCRCLVERMVKRGLVRRPTGLSDAQILNLLRAAKVPPEPRAPTISDPGAMIPGEQMVS